VPVRLAAHPHEHSPHPADIETAARVEPVLRDLVVEHRLDAIAVRCFDLVTTAYTSGCLALSTLNDRGVIAGCEGDVASTVGLLWARLLTGHTGWMANPAEINREAGIVELAHCTVPLSLVESYRLETHFESDLGVGIVGELPPGPVTVLRLGGDELQYLWCADGEALLTAPREQRCRTQLDVRIPPASAGELLDHPLGNHLVVLYGHHAAHLRAWWAEMIAD
jgi:L-fucose isomerase-like protein